MPLCASTGNFEKNNTYKIINCVKYKGNDELQEKNIHSWVNKIGNIYKGSWASQGFEKVSSINDYQLLKTGALKYFVKSV